MLFRPHLSPLVLLLIPNFGWSVEIEQAVPAGRLGSQAGDERSDNGLGIPLLWCPPGKFAMGSPESESGREGAEQAAEVELSQGFWMSKYEITQSEWEHVMGTTPWKSDRRSQLGAKVAATYINYRDVIEFCEKYTHAEWEAGRLVPDEIYSLPSEAQWEYACRAGTTTAYHFGEDPELLQKYAWYAGNNQTDGETGVHRVGHKAPSPWGFHDQCGNVWEWCLDAYRQEHPGGRDPRTPWTGSVVVIRGGALDFNERDARSAKRNYDPPNFRALPVGFRLALVESEHDE